MKFKLSALNKPKLSIWFPLVIFLGFFAVDTQAQDGEKLFKSYCASCHSPGTNKLVGPGLAGINEKYEKDWLHSWIKNSQALIQSGDADAVAIFQEYNQLVMPPQPVDDAEIEAILSYIDESNAG